MFQPLPLTTTQNDPLSSTAQDRMSKGETKQETWAKDEESLPKKGPTTLVTWKKLPDA